MELLRALGTLIESPSEEHARTAAALGLPPVPTPAEHGRVVARQRYPRASVYLGAEGMVGGEAQDRIAGFRRALGTPDREADHLASLLGLLAELDGWRRAEPRPARRALLSEARVTLVWEHLASWTGPYLACFKGCGAAFYEGWASLLAEALGAVERELAFPDYLPAALRAAPGLPDPRRDGGASFAAALLAPVRSGAILLRDDLVRLGNEARLACRAGERRYALTSFLTQDPGGTLEWLAGHARRWSARSAATGPASIAEWWSSRAATTARLLSELAAEVRRPVPFTAYVP